MPVRPNSKPRSNAKVYISTGSDGIGSRYGSDNGCGSPQPPPPPLTQDLKDQLPDEVKDRILPQMEQQWATQRKEVMKWKNGILDTNQDSNGQFDHQQGFNDQGQYRQYDREDSDDDDDDITEDSSNLPTNNAKYKHRQSITSGDVGLVQFLNPNASQDEAQTVAKQNSKLYKKTTKIESLQNSYNNQVYMNNNLNDFNNTGGSSNSQSSSTQYLSQLDQRNNPKFIPRPNSREAEAFPESPTLSTFNNDSSKVPNVYNNRRSNRIVNNISDNNYSNSFSPMSFQPKSIIQTNKWGQKKKGLMETQRSRERRQARERATGVQSDYNEGVHWKPDSDIQQVRPYCPSDYGSSSSASSSSSSGSRSQNQQQFHDIPEMSPQVIGNQQSQSQSQSDSNANIVANLMNQNKQKSNSNSDSNPPPPPPPRGRRGTAFSFFSRRKSGVATSQGPTSSLTQIADQEEGGNMESSSNTESNNDDDGDDENSHNYHKESNANGPNHVRINTSNSDENDPSKTNSVPLSKRRRPTGFVFPIATTLFSGEHGAQLQPSSNEPTPPSDVSNLASGLNNNNKSNLSTRRRDISSGRSGSKGSNIGAPPPQLKQAWTDDENNHNNSKQSSQGSKNSKNNNVDTATKVQDISNSNIGPPPNLPQPNMQVSKTDTIGSDLAPITWSTRQNVNLLSDKPNAAKALGYGPADKIHEQNLEMVYGNNKDKDKNSSDKNGLSKPFAGAFGNRNSGESDGNNSKDKRVLKINSIGSDITDGSQNVVGKISATGSQNGGSRWWMPFGRKTTSTTSDNNYNMGTDSDSIQNTNLNLVNNNSVSKVDSTRFNINSSGPSNKGEVNGKSQMGLFAKIRASVFGGRTIPINRDVDDSEDLKSSTLKIPKNVQVREIEKLPEEVRSRYSILVDEQTHKKVQNRRITPHPMMMSRKERCLLNLSSCRHCFTDPFVDITQAFWDALKALFNDTVQALEEHYLVSFADLESGSESSDDDDESPSGRRVLGVQQNMDYLNSIGGGSTEQRRQQYQRRGSIGNQSSSKSSIGSDLDRSPSKRGRDRQTDMVRNKQGMLVRRKSLDNIHHGHSGVSRGGSKEDMMNNFFGGGGRQRKSLSQEPNIFSGVGGLDNAITMLTGASTHLGDHSRKNSPERTSSHIDIPERYRTGSGSSDNLDDDGNSGRLKGNLKNSNLSAINKFRTYSISHLKSFYGRASVFGKTKSEQQKLGFFGKDDDGRSWLDRRKDAAIKRKKQKLLNEKKRRPYEVAKTYMLKYRNYSLNAKKEIDYETEDEQTHLERMIQEHPEYFDPNINEEIYHSQVAREARELRDKPIFPCDTFKFNFYMGIAIILNTVFIGLQTDMNVLICDKQGENCCPYMDHGNEEYGDRVVYEEMKKQELERNGGAPNSVYSSLVLGIGSQDESVKEEVKENDLPLLFQILGLKRVTEDRCFMREQQDLDNELQVIKPIPPFDSNAHWIWYLVNCLFLMLFTIELFYRYYFHKKDVMKDGLTMLDFILVSLGLIDTLFVSLLFPESQGVLFMFSSLRILRLLKIYRVIRDYKPGQPLVRENVVMSKNIEIGQDGTNNGSKNTNNISTLNNKQHIHNRNRKSNKPPSRFQTLGHKLFTIVLANMSKSLKGFERIFSALSRSRNTFLIVLGMLCCLIFFFACLFAEFVGKKSDIYLPYAKLSGWHWREHFGSTGSTMVTLLYISFRSCWSTEIARHVISNQFGLAWLFLLFTLIIWYGFFVLIAGVIITKVLNLGEERLAQQLEELHMLRVELLETLRSALLEADENGDEMLTLDEFETNIMKGRPELVSDLRNLVGVDLRNSRDLFDILDCDGEGAVHLGDFIGACLRIASVEEAQRRDVYATAKTLSIIQLKLENLKKSFAQFSKQIYTLNFYTESKVIRQHNSLLTLSKEANELKHRDETLHILPKSLPGDASFVSQNIAQRPGVSSNPNNSIAYGHTFQSASSRGGLPPMYPDFVDEVNKRVLGESRFVEPEVIYRLGEDDIGGMSGMGGMNMSAFGRFMNPGVKMGRSGQNKKGKR